MQQPCGGEAFYCSGGNEAPVAVSKGYYSTSTPGASDGPLVRTGQAQCEPGYYCVSGVRTACAQGTYGAHAGEFSPSCSGTCVAGFYGAEPGHTTPQCSGPCAVRELAPPTEMDAA